jgi:hypothetical protein
MEKILERSTVKVVIVKNQAYWVYENNIYVADVDDYGRVDGQNAKKIDVFGLPQKKVNELLEIIDSISE